MFIEEPVLPDNVDVMVTVTRSTTIPIATGERLFTKWGFREVLEKQAATVLQPDLSHAGGILECKKTRGDGGDLFRCRRTALSAGTHCVSVMLAA